MPKNVLNGPQARNEIRRIVIRGLQQGGLRWHGRMVKERLSGPTTPTSLSVQTGALRQSVGYNVREAVNPILSGFVRDTVNYARIHEFGGTITPKRAKMLAIPLGTAKERRSGKLAFGPRAYPKPLVAIKTRRGNVLLIEKPLKSKKGATRATQVTKAKVTKDTSLPRFVSSNLKAAPPIKAVYLLKESVFIPARLGFRKTFREEAKKTVALIRSQLSQIKVQVRLRR